MGRSRGPGERFSKAGELLHHSRKSAFRCDGSRPLQANDKTYGGSSVGGKLKLFLNCSGRKPASQPTLR